MKKKYIITFLFLLFFNINTIKAQNESVNDASGSSGNGKYEYLFEVTRYGKETEDASYKSFEDFYNPLCKANGADCQYYVAGINSANNSTSNAKDYADQTTGANKTKYKSFYLKNGTFNELRDFLKNNNCGNQRCIDYVFNNYSLKDIVEYDKGSNQHKIYEELKGTAGYTNCSYKFATKNSGELELNIDFKKNTEMLPTIITDNKVMFMFRKANYNDELYDELYGKVYLREEEESSSNNFIQQFYDEFDSNNTCPELCFVNDGFDNGWYQTFDIEKTLDGKNSYLYYQCTQNGQNPGIKSIADDYESYLQKNEVNLFTDCKTMFNADAGSKRLFELLRFAKNLVHLFIPLLLLGLGTLDFAKAIFSGSEDDMKKAQSKFIKRVIIAICIFLIPTLLKVILTIANEVWGNIDTTFCGILD